MLATGGVLLNPRDDDAAAGVVRVGLSRFKTSSRFTKGRGATVQTLRDRLAAAEGILEAPENLCILKRSRLLPGDRSLGSVDSDTARRNAIESVVDNASRARARARARSWPRSGQVVGAGVHISTPSDADWLICEVDIVATPSRTRRARARGIARRAAHASGAAKAAPASPAASDGRRRRQDRAS